MSVWNKLIYKVLPLLVLVFIACGKSNRDNEVAQGKYKFIYYPDINMYYDVAAGQYLFSLDSARTWTTVNEQTQDPPATLGEGQVLYSNEKQVWKQNEEHRLQFNGVIYNVVKPGTTMAAAKNEVAERKKPKSVSPKPEPEKEKKGIGKFFQNLFGKKKKDNG